MGWDRDRPEARQVAGHWVSSYCYLFSVFVGLNLFHRRFTNWCPMMTILRKPGVQDAWLSSRQLHSSQSVKIVRQVLLRIGIVTVPIFPVAMLAIRILNSTALAGIFSSLR